MVDFAKGGTLKNVVMLEMLIGLLAITTVYLFVLFLYMDWTVPHEDRFPVFTHVAEKRFQTSEDIRLYNGILGV